MNIIGSGSYSKVYAIDNYAIKVIDNIFESAIKEIAFVCLCDHPNIIKYIHIEYKELNDQNKWRFCIKMLKYKYTLHKIMTNIDLENNHKRISLVIKVISLLVSAVAYLHSFKIIHGDIKPDNILLNLDNSVDLVLCDFGIASFKETCKKTIQTITYRSPEVKFLNYGMKADVWSIGCILLELISGKPAIGRFGEIYDDPVKNIEKLLSISYVDCYYINLADKIKTLLPSWCPIQILDIIANCLMLNPKQRINSSRLNNYFNGFIYNKKLFTEYENYTCLYNVNNINYNNFSLKIAESIYRKIPQNYENQISSLFLSYCICDIKNNSFKDIIDINKLMIQTIKIILLLKGRLL